MKASILPLLCFLLAISVAPLQLLNAANGPTEQQLIQVLQSNASPREKDAACARLKFIGSAKSVPAVAALLTDTNLSHSARYVLESMAYPEARLALEQALSKTESLTLAGIIHSLAVRGEAASVPALKPLLTHSSDEIATAAALALGRIGTDPELLFSGFESCKPAAKRARTDSILACGAKFLSEGKLDKAHELFQKLLPLVQDPHLRLAAYRGVLLSAGDAEREQLLLKAISGDDGPEQTAALQVAREAGSESTTQKLCESLPKLQPHVQTALIEALAQREDPTAAAPIAAFAKTSRAEARLAAIAALGSLGDQNILPFLAETAAAGTPTEKTVARQALVDLRRGNVDSAMVELLSKGSPEIQAEIARAVGARGDRRTIPLLLTLAKSESDSVRQAAVAALTPLAGEAELPALVRLVVEASSDTIRDSGAEALNTTYQRLASQGKKLDLQPVTTAMGNAPVPAKAVLLGVLGNVVNPDARATLVKASSDPAPEIRSAAIRAMAASEDPALLPDLVAVAMHTPEENLKTVAISGCAKLASDEHGSSVPPTTRVKAIEKLLAANVTPGQARLLISALGSIKQPESLAVLVKALERPEVQNETTQAILAVAASLPGDPQAQSALEKALAKAPDTSTRSELEKALKQTKAANAYISVWRVAGPYRQEGKNYAALFDIPFAPELASVQQDAWRVVRATNNAQQPGLVDLLKTMGGQQCVGYAEVQIHSAKAQTAMLELSTDDGVKAWLNGKVIHANNTARPIQAAVDKVRADLKEGWNPLRLKITQNDQGWEFTARLVKPDGSPLEGLKFAAEQTP